MSVRGALRYLFKSLTRQRPAMLRLGDSAPDFQVKDAFGHDLRLHDYRGKKVVLWFFPKANTPG